MHVYCDIYKLSSNIKEIVVYDNDKNHIKCELPDGCEIKKWDQVKTIE